MQAWSEAGRQLDRVCRSSRLAVGVVCSMGENTCGTSNVGSGTWVVRYYYSVAAAAVAKDVSM